MENDLISRSALFDAMRDNEFQTFCPLDEVDEVIAAAPAVEAEPKWISVEERLPEDDEERVLVALNDDCIVGHPRMDTDRWCCGMWVRYGRNVTHWMPLPEPPKMDAKEDDHA